MILLILFIAALVLGFVFIYVCSEKCWDFTVPVSWWWLEFVAVLYAEP